MICNLPHQSRCVFRYTDKIYPFTSWCDFPDLFLNIPKLLISLKRPSASITTFAPNNNVMIKGCTDIDLPVSFRAA